MSQRHDSPSAAREGDSVATLSKIFIEHDGYISDKWEQYLPAYEAVLRRFIDSAKPVRLLEIGVQNGGSLQIWSKYLPPGSIMVGIDIDPACAGFRPETNISILIGDAGDKVAIDRMLGDAKFDIIIDDASHRSDHVVSTFNACFGRLNRGGLYIVEDLHCSYRSSHGGGFRLAGSSMEWFKGLADALNVDHFEPDASGKLDGIELERLGQLGREIARITFFDSLVVVEKLTSERRRPYRRVVTGQNAHVVDVIGTIALDPNTLRNLLVSPAADSKFRPELLERLASAIEEAGRSRAMLAQEETRHENQMHAASARIERHTADAAERDAEIARLQDALSASDSQLSSARAERDAEVARLQDALSASDLQLSLAKAERDAETARLQDALSASDLQLSLAKAERDAEIARLRDALSASDLQLSLAKAERDAETARLRDALSASDLQLSSAKAERDAEIARLAEKDALLDQAEQIISDISERYTRILRKNSFRKLRYALKMVLLRFPVRTSQYNLIRNSAFFDQNYYLGSNPDFKAAKFDAAVHYLQFGGQQGRDPGPRFSEAGYRVLSPDVAASSLSALEHYESHGRHEGRRLLSSGPRQPR